jgi:hypothetical protein
MERNTLYGHTVEILSITGGESQGVPMALVELRPNAARQLEAASRLQSILLMFDKEQCVRLRDTLHVLLSDPESWLFMPEEEQMEIAVEEEPS